MMYSSAIFAGTTALMLLDAVRRAGSARRDVHFFAIPYAARAVTVGLSKLGLDGAAAGAVGRWSILAAAIR